MGLGVDTEDGGECDQMIEILPLFKTYSTYSTGKKDGLHCLSLAIDLKAISLDGSQVGRKPS